ncbi:MAG: hypothetical protein M1541_01375, partial [Acidobacteria bacterium]|nr:hypothetical protein [Acidobacteriota bacterium]
DIVFGVCSRGTDAAWNAEKCERALSLLAPVSDPQLQKMVVVTSIEDLKWLIAKRLEGLVWVAYNSERGMTPAAELGDIRASVTEFARIAHAAGLRAIWAPTNTMLQADESVLELTRNLDGMAFQHQKVLQYQGVPAFIELTKQRAQAARRYNPAVRTSVQVVVGRGSEEQLVDGLRAIKGDVSEIKIFSMRDTGAIGRILRAVRN